MAVEEPCGEGALGDGWFALRVGAWSRAREFFVQQLAVEETAEALEGLGWAGYCLDDDELTFNARERAYRLYRERDEDRAAARVAAWLASDCLEFRGEPAVANGWLQRAHRLLDDLEPEADHGWLALHEGAIALGMHEDTATARELGVWAAELGRRFTVPELEMLGSGWRAAPWSARANSTRACAAWTRRPPRRSLARRRCSPAPRGRAAT